MMNQIFAAKSLVLSLCFNVFAKETFPVYLAADVPQTPIELWKDYDPRSEALDVQVVKEWKNDGVITRYITFKVGKFKNTDSRIAAYYSFPDNGKKNAAFVWCHGGGQRAERAHGVSFAKHGFATIDINWLGRPMENDVEVNTDWGKVDPSQGPRFYSKALRKGWKRSLQPDQYSIDPVVSPRNSNWFLLVTAAKRAITFLEQQPEVHADRIGMAGFSMGGMVTSLTAMDPRLKAVVPFVGGTGYKFEDFPGGIKGSSIRQHFQDLDMYRKTVDPSAYWPLVTCPVLFISSSNDFHSAFDRIYKSMALLKHNEWRVSTNIHENHDPGPEQWALQIKWFNLHLKGINQKIPVTPPSTLEINGQTARFTVTPEDRQQRLLITEIYYSYDPNARTRFWTRADAVQSGDSWSLDLEIHKQLPLYVYASCRYSIDEEMETLKGPTSTIVVNSLEQSIVPEYVDLEALTVLHHGNTVIDDFKNGLQDWAVREGGELIRTYKFQSPDVDRSNDRRLLLRIDPSGRKLSLRLSTGSSFLHSQLNQGSFFVTKSVEGQGLQDVVFEPKDFKKSGKKRQAGEVIDWSRITRFDLSILDLKTKQKVDLSSEQGISMLKLISLVDE
ncbi:MAG: dienelactone hydrolase family protein [Rubritalea sp.]|uniref:alpha/beta hydrolase n=1 Tax=Rubritalea sp. TaxID=2109375 RepID=UPI0032429221